METLENIKQEFKERTVKQGLAIKEGSGRKANHQHKKIWQLYERVKSMNRLDLFKDFLDDENEHTRLWAAYFCILAYPKEARKALKKMAKSSIPVIWLQARDCLKTIEEGNFDEFHL